MMLQTIWSNLAEGEPQSLDDYSKVKFSLAIWAHLPELFVLAIPIYYMCAINMYLPF